MGLRIKSGSGEKHLRDSWSDSEGDVSSSCRLARNYWRERDGSLEEDDRRMVELRRREQGRVEKTNEAESVGVKKWTVKTLLITTGKCVVTVQRM